MSVRNALLGLIRQKPRHGYELLTAFTALVGGEKNWEVKPAQIYMTLNRLNEAGLIHIERVEQEGGTEKQIYAITEKGEAELKKWLEEPVKTTYRRDEFFLKWMISLALEDEDPVRLLYLQRASLYKELHKLNQEKMKANPGTELAHVLLLDQAIMHTEADLRWLDMIEARLDEIKRQPLPEGEPRARGRPTKVREEIQSDDPGG